MVTKKRGVSTREPSCHKTAKKGLMVVFLLSFCFNITFMFYHDHIRTMDDSELVPSSFALSIWFDIYSCVRLVFVKLLPFVLVAIFNIVIIKVTWSNNRRVSSIGGFQTPLRDKRNDTQYKMTQMLLSITMVFLITKLLEPFIHPSIYTNIFGTCSDYSTNYNILVVVANTAESISFASNFISYCVFNQQFVTTLKTTFGCSSTITQINVVSLKVIKNEFNAGRTIPVTK